jgi:hypothetical protein
MKPKRKILVIDVGGTHVKLLATGQKVKREFASGPKMGPVDMARQVKDSVKDWDYDVISMGYPGPVVHGRPLREPHNLAAGWVRFDYKKAFDREIKIINDAAMQALGSYKKGRMLFLGLGTGLGSTFKNVSLFTHVATRYLNPGNRSQGGYANRVTVMYDLPALNRLKPTGVSAELNTYWSAVPLGQ